MKKIFTLLFLIAYSLLISQEVKFVDAPNGLVIRDAPSTESNRINKLNHGTSVFIIDETDIELTITENNNKIRGNWVEIKQTKGDKTGFVFDGYLSSTVINKGKKTENFYLTKVDSLTRRKYWDSFSNGLKPEPTTIYLRDISNKDLLEFSIPELETYEDTTIREFKIDGLSNIIKVITIESTYNACCSDIFEQNYLINSNNKLIEIPEISNVHCDGPEPYFGYIFPNDKKGHKDKIKYAKITPSKEGANDTIDILKVFAWNGSELKLINE